MSDQQEPLVSIGQGDTHRTVTPQDLERAEAFAGWLLGLGAVLTGWILGTLLDKVR